MHTLTSSTHVSRKMIDRTYNFLKDTFKYYGPFLLLPLLLIYSLDFIRALCYLIQLVATIFISLSFSSFILGTVLAVTKSSEIHGMRLVKIIKPINWGYELANWLMDEGHSSQS